MNPILQAALGSILRFVLAAGAGWLVEHGIWTEAEASTYVAAAALALLSLGWSLWRKYHDRIKLFTALDMQPGATEADVKRAIASGRGATLADVTKAAPLVLLVLLAGMTSGCALKGDARHRAVVASTGLYTAIAVVDDTEMTLASIGSISPEQHRELNPKIVSLLKAGRAANAAIASWPQGKPAPTEVQDAIHQLSAVADAVIAVLPDGANKSKLQTAILKAEAVANALLLVRLVTGGA